FLSVCEIVRDRYVVLVVDGPIDSLAGHTHLSPFCVEGVICFAPSRVVGHVVTDINANSHCFPPLIRTQLASSGSLGSSRVQATSNCQPIESTIGPTNRPIMPCTSVTRRPI